MWWVLTPFPFYSAAHLKSQQPLFAISDVTNASCKCCFAPSPCFFISARERAKRVRARLASSNWSHFSSLKCVSYILVMGKALLVANQHRSHIVLCSKNSGLFPPDLWLSCCPKQSISRSPVNKWEFPAASAVMHVCRIVWKVTGTSRWRFSSSFLLCVLNTNL